MADPRYLTERTTTRTYGPKIAKIAALLGRPLMPWQQLAADLIGEIDENGYPVHKTVVVTVPRQSGKTALMHSVMVHRMFTRTQARVWYTAETGTKAKAQLKELIETVELPKSKLRPVLDCKRGAGDTSVKLPRLGSAVTAFTPDEKNIHGSQADLVVLDEAWFYSEEQAAMIMAGVTPTKNTRPHAQTVILSTMGTAASTWFHGKVEQGRRGELALIDYGIAPDADPDDDDVIAAAHPAIGFTSPASIIPDARTEYAGMPSEFIRAYGNRPTAAAERLFSPELVELATVTADLPDGPASFGAAVSYDRDETVIVACVLAPDGVPWCEVLHVLPGTDGAAELLAGEHVMIAGEGPGASIADQLDTAGEKVVRVTGAELSNSTGDLLDRIRRPETLNRESGVRLRAHPAFAKALEVATLRNSGDRQAWARRGSAGSVAALEAATLAIRAALNRPRPPVKPVTRIWSD